MRPGRGGTRGRGGTPPWGRRAAADPIAAPAPDPASRTRAARIAGLALIALATVALGAYALLFRRVGDYLTESDFYGGYALGARALQHGQLDFARYGVVGPVYEVLLAATGLLTPDLFTAARLLSVLAAAVTLLAWWRIAERRLDAGAALVLVTLLVANPTCMRYGYSVTTDMVSMALFSLSAWASLAATGPRTPLWAGVLAGLATLTRYNLVSLLPATLVLEAGRASQPAGRRVRRALLVLAGFLLPVLPWTLASLAAGHVPGAHLLQDREFFLESQRGASEGDHGTGVALARAPTGLPSLAGTVTAVAARFGRGLLEHPARDARDLLGPPATLLALAGLAVALARRQWRYFAPFAPLLVFTYGALAPIFYTERYSMVLAPLLLLPGAWLVASLGRAPWRRPLPALAASGLAALVLVPTVGWAVTCHRAFHEIMPLEARESGEALHRVATPGGRVVARKAQAAWYAGLEPVMFPAATSLPELATFCRERAVGYLYYSWYEAQMRPTFAFLLDTSAVVPGLAVVHATRRPASATYRIGPEFGAMPEWWEDEPTRRRVAARVNSLIRPGAASAPFLVQLAADGLERGRNEQALADAEAAMQADPQNDDARFVAAEAHRRLGRPGRAVELLRPVVERRPDLAEARLALGRALLDAGRDAEAAEAWRPVVGASRDPGLLREMERLFTALGDSGAAGEARRVLGHASR